ncbi:MAG: long-chain-acyl-CoA synthetase [Bacteroidota bacterium]
MAYAHPDVTLFNLLMGMLAHLPRLEQLQTDYSRLQQLSDDMPISIGKILEDNARQYADRPAIFFEDLSYTHAEFNALVNQYAHTFADHGIAKGSVVVVFLENRLETVLLISALAKLGAVASLINANQRAAVLLHSIKADQGQHFVIGEDRIDAFEDIRPDLNLSETDILFWMINRGDQELPKDYLPLADLVQKAPSENLACTQNICLGDRFANIFTSGTTGMPKASKQTHRKWYACYLWYGKLNMNLNAHDVLYVALPFFHTNAMIVAWPSAAAGGAAMVIRRKLSISNFWKDVKRYDVSAFIYIGEVCRYLMNKPESPSDAQHRIRAIIGNGLRPDIWKAFKQRFHIQQVNELYGASDGTVAFTNFFNLDCTVGVSMADYAIVRYDVDNEEVQRNSDGFMERVEIGQAGLLLGHLTEQTHVPGYVNPAKNKERILHDVFEAGDRWFNMGDLVRDIGCGHVQFADRLGDTFRWKGENVSTAEVEAIINQLPEVSHSAVYGVSLPHIDGRAGMTSIMSPQAVEEFDLGRFARILRDQLPSYAVPMFLRFVQEFDKTATHKIKKSVLKQEGIEHMDPIFVLLPGGEAYEALSPSTRQDIQQGRIRF